MKEYGGGPNPGFWFEDKGEYRIATSRFLPRGGRVSRLLGTDVREVEVDALTSTVSIQPATEEDLPRVTTKIIARGDDENASREAALKQYRQMHVEKVDGKLTIREQRDQEEDVVIARVQDGVGSFVEDIPKPRDTTEGRPLAPVVRSSVTVFLSDRSRLNSKYDISTEDATIMMSNLGGEIKASTAGGDIVSGNQVKGSLDAQTDSGRVVINAFGGEELSIDANIGDVFIHHVDGAKVNIETNEGPVKMHGAEIVAPSRIATWSTDIEVGVTNTDLKASLSTSGTITTRNFRQDPEASGGELLDGRWVSTVQGSIGHPQAHEEGLTIESKFGNLELRRDTGEERTIPTHRVKRDDK